jgi:hypothetical protein
MIKPPYEQVLVGMGWNAGGPRELEEKKEKKRSRRCARKKKERKIPRRQVSPGPGVGFHGGGMWVIQYGM